MERKFMLWFGYPFIALATTVLALSVLGLVNRGILFVLLIALGPSLASSTQSCESALAIPGPKH